MLNNYFAMLLPCKHAVLASRLTAVACLLSHNNCLSVVVALSVVCSSSGCVLLARWLFFLCVCICAYVSWCLYVRACASCAQKHRSGRSDSTNSGWLGRWVVGSVQSGGWLPCVSRVTLFVEANCALAVGYFGRHTQTHTTPRRD